MVRRCDCAKGKEVVKLLGGPANGWKVRRGIVSGYAAAVSSTGVAHWCFEHYTVVGLMTERPYPSYRKRDLPGDARKLDDQD